MSIKKDSKPQPKKSRAELRKQLSLAQESEKVKKASAPAIKQAALNLIERSPMLIYNISAEPEKIQGGAG